MKPLLHRFTLLIALSSAAFLLSCDSRKEVTASEPGVWVMPRFADGTTVLKATTRVIGKLSAKGPPDTLRNVRYEQGGIIEFGTLPPQTPFRLTLTGYDATNTALWWSYADDTTGLSPVKDVLMKLAPVPLAAGSLLTGSNWYKGDTLLVPTGAFYTVDGSDPRTSTSALPVLDPKGLAVDSNDVVKVAVHLPRDSVLDRPLLWSPVQTFTLTIDAMDTITMLDTLILTSTYSLAPDSLDADTNRTWGAVRSGKFLPGSNQRTDTLLEFFGPGVHDRKLMAYLVPTSPRATILCDGDTIKPSSFPEIAIPVDSIVRIQVLNGSRSTDFEIRLVRRNFVTPDLRFDSVRSTPSGLVMDTSSNILSIELPPDQNSLVFRPFPDSGQVVEILGKVLFSTDSIELAIGSDTLTILLLLRWKDSSNFLQYKLRINRSISGIAFRDTTWGVPWRDVAYDTLLDARNGRKYRTVMVGNARWMAENLNYRVDSSFCPSNMADSCSKYGRLYRWAAAADTVSALDSAVMSVPGVLKGICPAGWHLPSQEEWMTLANHVGASKSATQLRSTGASWDQGGGQDSVGIRILPAGVRQTAYPNTPRYRGLPYWVLSLQGAEAWYWTSTQSALNGRSAVAIRLTSSSPALADMSNTEKADALSIRCVEDAAP